MPYPIRPLTPKEEQAEAKIAEQLIQILRREMKKYPPSRGGHAKTHGVLTAEFVVQPNLPDIYRVGLFAKESTFNCTLRFSNFMGNKNTNDRGKSVQGLGIFFLESDGKTPMGMGFSMENFTAFPIGTPSAILDIFYWMTVFPSLPYLCYFLTGLVFVLKGNIQYLFNIFKAFREINSLSDQVFYSATPYSWGPNTAVKYRVRPMAFTTPPEPLRTKDPNFLASTVDVFAKNGARFEFAVQFQKEGMPIDEASIEWSEAQSPFFHVATIHVPAQVYQTKQRLDYGDKYFITVSDKFQDHKPLGSMNRLRNAIYPPLHAYTLELLAEAEANKAKESV